MNKNIIFTLIILFSLTAEAQLQNNRNRRQRVMDRPPASSQRPKDPVFDVERNIGMIFYKIEKVAKKVRVKKSSDTYKKLTSILYVFNKDLKQVKRINTFLLSEGKTKVEVAQKDVLENRDYSVLEKAYKEVSVSFESIVKVIEEKEKELDKKLEKILSEKQLKKWKKYKKKIKG